MATNAFRVCSSTMATWIVRRQTFPMNRRSLSRPRIRHRTTRTSSSVRSHRWFSPWLASVRVSGYAGMSKTVSLPNRDRADRAAGIVERMRHAHRLWAHRLRRAQRSKCPPHHSTRQHIHRRRRPKWPNSISHRHMNHCSQRKRPPAKFEMIRVSNERLNLEFFGQFLCVRISVHLFTQVLHNC